MIITKIEANKELKSLTRKPAKLMVIPRETTKRYRITPQKSEDKHVPFESWTFLNKL